MARLGLLVAMLPLGGCGGGSAAPAVGPTTASRDEAGASGFAFDPIEAPCEYLFKMLKQSSPAGPWETEALVEADRATTLLDAGDPATAALRFIGCAVALRGAPEDDRTAEVNAEVCYYNAAHAFATAGRWTSDGQIALEAAQVEDPARAGYIRDGILAAPPRDCVAPAN